MSKVPHSPSTGKVAREHRSPSAEELDRRQDDLPVRRRHPGLARNAEPRDLHRGVRACSERRQRALPSGDPRGAAIYGQPRVIENDGRFRVRVREQHRLVKVPPRRLEIEAQAMPGEQREPRAPSLVGHAARRTVAGRGVRARFVADPAHEREGGLALEHRRGIVAVEPRLCDGDRRQSRLAPQPFDVMHLPHRVARVPLRFDVDRCDDAQRRRIG